MGHNSDVGLKNRKRLSFVSEAHCLEKTRTMASSDFAQNFGLDEPGYYPKVKEPN